MPGKLPGSRSRLGDPMGELSGDDCRTSAYLLVISSLELSVSTGDSERGDENGLDAQ